MAEMTIEQQRALARARARMRASNSIIPSGDYTDADWDKLETDNMATRDMSTGQRAVAGYGSALPSMARGVGQRLGLVSQEHVDEMARLEKPLLDTTAGRGGLRVWPCHWLLPP